MLDRWLKSNLKNRYTMRVRLTLYVFLVQFISMLVIIAISIVLVKMGWLATNTSFRFIVITIGLFVSSILIGTGLAAASAKGELRPYKELIAATKRIAAGDFDVQIDIDGPREVEELAENFNRMAKELRSIETLRNNFISVISHEFKTPVVSIKGFAKLLKKDTLSEESRDEYLDVIINESDRLAHMAGNVLLLSKLENQGIADKSTYFRIDEQLRRTVLLLEQEWEKKNLHLEVHLGEVPYTGKEELLTHVWTNLLNNAIKFSPDGGVISVIAHTDAGRVSVEVSDNGIGMDAETVKHIFLKFFQADKSRATAGNGLGLPLVKKIVELHGGEILVESHVGEGSSFRVLLPIVADGDF